MRSHFWAFWFCHVSFSFSASLLVFRELFGFAVSFSVLPRAFLNYLVLPCAFWFCREPFGFVVSFLVFPWAIWFRRELFGFTITVVGHRTNGPLVIMGRVTFFFQLKKRHLFYLYFSLLVVFFEMEKNWKKRKRKYEKKN